MPPVKWLIIEKPPWPRLLLIYVKDCQSDYIALSVNSSQFLLAPLIIKK